MGCHDFHDWRLSWCFGTSYYLTLDMQIMFILFHIKLGAYLIESRLGRRWSLAGCTFITAFFCIVFILVKSTWAVRMSTVGISLSATVSTTSF
jgi:hypothetical protein